MEQLHGSSLLGAASSDLEVASAAVQLGKSVTVLEAQPELLMRVVSPPIARFLQDEHRKNGVVIRTSAKVTKIRGHEGRVRHVVLDDQDIFEADLVVVGIGSLPNSELATAAGLQCQDGVVVDRYGKTSDLRYRLPEIARFMPAPIARRNAS